MKSYGKQFENEIKQGFERAGICYDRFKDDNFGYSGVSNPCDFSAYLWPNKFYFECKEIRGNTLNFKSDIRESQWRGLIEKGKYDGVYAGFIIWFFDHGLTIYIDVNELDIMRCHGIRSLNIKDIEKINHINVYGEKKRVLYRYNMAGLLNDIKKEYLWNVY